jgi:hypothetical protein
MAKALETDAEAATLADSTTTAPAAPANATATRYVAPDHVSAIYFSTGREVLVGEDGTLTAPDDLSDDERLQLTRAGFSAA